MVSSINNIMTVFFRLLVIGLVMSASNVKAEKVYYKSTETIPYEVIKQLNEDVEIRQYPEAIGVTSKGSSENGAFRLLFNYISGDNTSNSDIAMTSPVEVANASTDIAMTSPVEVSENNGMMFFLPSQYTQETAPVPTHPDVSLVNVPSRQVASITYSGLDTDSKRDAYEQTLLSLLTENGFAPSGEASYLGYDSPFTLPWNKRHEIIIPIE